MYVTMLPKDFSILSIQVWVLFVLTEMGSTYEFRVSAKNAVDFGEVARQTIRTPDGSELVNLDRISGSRQSLDRI